MGPASKRGLQTTPQHQQITATGAAQIWVQSGKFMGSVATAAAAAYDDQYSSSSATAWLVSRPMQPTENTQVALFRRLAARVPLQFVSETFVFV
jgi:hypothetical protein